MPETDSFELTSAYRFTIGGMACDLSEGVIEANGELFRLEPRLCGVLALLVQRGQTTVTRDEFLETAWDNAGSDEALTQAISRLRKILGDSALIETVPRVGYRLAVAPQPAAAERPSRSRLTKHSLFHSPNHGAIYICIMIIVVGAAAFWLGTLHSVKPTAPLTLETEKGPDYEFHKIPDG